MRLRILTHRYGPCNCVPGSPMYSWAVRELGATIRHFKEHALDLTPIVEDCDVAVYFAHLGGPDMPTIEALKAARKHCRLVGVFGDGGCPLGRPMIQRYLDEDVFDCLVNIDGTLELPLRPQDFNYWGMFDNVPYGQCYTRPRTRRLGFNGAASPERLALIAELGKDIEASVGYQPFLPEWSYRPYADWMLSTRAIINTSWSTFALRKNGKGKANEAFLAGCLLFETGGSSVRNWFIPSTTADAAAGKADDAEYLEYPDFAALPDLPISEFGAWDMGPRPEFKMNDKTYKNVCEERDDRKATIVASMPKVAEEIRAVLARPDFDEYAEAVGQRAKVRLLRDYGPEKFWKRVTGN